MRYGQKHFYMQFKCMSFPFSPYLSQILMKLLEVLINLHIIKISIYLCNVILFLFGTINCTTKDQSQPVWTDFFHVVDWLGPVFKGPVAAPEYLNWSRSVVVASCLVLEKKTGLNWTLKHYLSVSSSPFISSSLCDLTCKLFLWGRVLMQMVLAFHESK